MMNTLLLFLFILTLPASATPLKLLEGLEKRKSILVEGKKRDYLMHVPRSYRPASGSTPLLIALHGGGGNMEIMARDRFYQIISKSEEAGFIAVFPNGYSKGPFGKMATWNAGNCCGDARDEKSNDVQFIKELIVEVTKSYNIDANRVYAIGMSNGAMLAYRLACELSDYISGIAAVAGTDNTISCTPKSPIPLLHIHAKNDDNVRYNGGAGSGSVRDQRKITHYTSVPDTIKKWVALNSCGSRPQVTHAKKGVLCERYSECKNNAVVELCSTDEGGHSWPGGIKPLGIGDTPTRVISATDTIWSFFQGL